MGTSLSLQSSEVKTIANFGLIEKIPRILKIIRAHL